MHNVVRPWPALWALVLGFFMILVDSTIVSVATPAIITGLDADINSVIWVMSAYLLAYAVPLLITGRLGDRFGPKNIYLTGLVVFTVASVLCGFSASIEMLIASRVLQGLGAALMTPQTMAVITRIFPADRRGKAMGLWGAVAGFAVLAGPILGGLIVDSLGWEWIFFVNLPVGVIAFVMAWRLVPVLPTHTHRFDILGVVLSAIGLFLVVYGIQEGEHYGWGTIVGPISVWTLIGAGILVLAGFVYWQSVNKGEPLLPLKLFKERNFSLANVAIMTVGFAITGMSLPLMIYAQTVRGLTPTQAALLLVPMAVISGGLAPVAGKLVDTINPKWVALFGLLSLAGGLFWLGSILSADVPIWLLLLPMAVLGLANAGIWAPLSTTATRNLSPSDAGAGSGVYSTTQQMGAVLGSAGIAAIMQSRLVAELPAGAGAAAGGVGGIGGLPEFLHAGFSTAMGQSLFLPATAALIGAIAVLFFLKPKPLAWGPRATETESETEAGSETESESVPAA